MGRRRKNYPVLTNLTVEKYASLGKGLAYADEQVVFVKDAVPGDIVDAQVKKKKSKYMEAVPVAFHQKSEDRVEPFCEHFGTCGGCKWQHLSYEKQLEYKQNEVIGHLERIGKVPLPESKPIMGSKEIRYYRNKLEFTFSEAKWLTIEEIESGGEFDRRALGFHLPGLFDKIVDVDTCHLQAEPSNAIRNAVRAYAKEHNLPFNNIRDHVGFLRNLIIRTAITGDVMVLLQVYEERSEDLFPLLDHLKASFPEITSLMYVVNNKANETFHDLEVKLYAGEPFIKETMEDLTFRVGPKSFYQTNSKQALHLYEVARDFAGLSGNETVYDLYTGTGTIAQFVAKKAKKVVGIEYVPQAIEDAKENAKLNNIENCVFYAGDMKDVLNADLFAEHGAPDVIITDPPRVGMHQDVVDTLLRVAAPKVVYVSCNSATQARDLELLGEKYEVQAIQPVDMFPHTYHVENVVLLKLKTE